MTYSDYRRSRRSAWGCECTFVAKAPWRAAGQSAQTRWGKRRSGSSHLLASSQIGSELLQWSSDLHGEGIRHQGSWRTSTLILFLDWDRCALPGITEMVFRARSTLKVRSAETFPRSINSVTYLELDEKSREIGCCFLCRLQQLKSEDFDDFNFKNGSKRWLHLSLHVMIDSLSMTWLLWTPLICRHHLQIDGFCYV